MGRPRCGGCGTMRSLSARSVIHSSSEKNRCSSGCIASRSSMTRRVCSFHEGVLRLARTSYPGKRSRIAPLLEQCQSGETGESETGEARRGGKRRPVEDILPPVAPAAHVAVKRIGMEAHAGNAEG